MGNLRFGDGKPVNLSALQGRNVATEAAAADGMGVGVRVRHAKFGTGRILSLEGSGDDMKVVIDFGGVGVKRLLKRLAVLEVLG